MLRGVRGRMLLLLLVASVPVVGIAGANAFLSYEAELAAGRRTAAILGEVSATRHGAILQFLDNTLTGLARQEEVLGDPALCSRFLRRLLTVDSAYFSNLWVMDPGGEIRCSALPMGEPVSMAGDPVLAEARADRPSLSGFRTGRISGEPVSARCSPPPRP